MMWGDYERPMHDGWSVGGWLLMVLVLLFFLALLATVVYLLLRGQERPGPAEPRGHRPSLHTAEQLLAERYARGELDEEEYRHRREVLRL
jgi:putative membrane protein